MCPVDLLSAENPDSELLLLKYSLRYEMGSFMNLRMISLHLLDPLILEFFFGMMNILVFSEKSSRMLCPKYKRSTGQMIFQRRKDRIETSGFCKGLLHNLMLVNG